jgi:hypothetical protein
MAITKGQQYAINSFHLGFINVGLIDMLVEVVEVDHEQNILALAPRQLPGTHPKKTFFTILAWFRDEYPKQEKGKLIINNLAAFEKLIEVKIAILHGGEKKEDCPFFHCPGSAPAAADQEKKGKDE